MIKNPKSQTITAQTKNGMVKSTIKWSSGFANKWNGQFTRAQKYVDNEIIRKCEPYTSRVTGMLIKSATLGTVIGSGLIRWIATYARKVYYSVRAIGRPSGALRGGKWFERMKIVSGKAIIAAAKKIAGGGRA